MEAPDLVMGIDRSIGPWLPTFVWRLAGELDLDAVEVPEDQGVNAEADRPRGLDAELSQAAGPELQRASRDRERHHGHLPAACRPPGEVGPAEKGHRAPRRAEIVAEIDVVGVGHVEVDCLLYEAEAEDADVEVDVLLDVAGDACDVVDSGNVGRHREFMLVRAVVFGGLLFDAVPDLGRKGFLELLLDVRDQADRPRHDRQPAADLPGDLELAEDRANRAGRVDRQLATVQASRLLRDEPHQFHVAPGEAVLLRNLEEALGPRIDRFMDGVPQPGDGLLRLPVSSDYAARNLAQVGCCR